MIEELWLADADASTVPFLDGERTPAGSGWLACALHASATSFAEIRDVLGWFGVDRSRPAIRNWWQSFADSHEQTFTAGSVPCRLNNATSRINLDSTSITAYNQDCSSVILTVISRRQ